MAAAGKWKPEVVARLEKRTVRGDDCWLFAGAHSGAGYAQMGANGKVEYAHRIAYEVHTGPIPDGYDVDHLCRNPGCIRPDHLEAVSHKENVLRGERGRLKTHCTQGHPWVDENIYSHKGRRSCLRCRNDRNAAWNATHKRREA